MWVKGLVGMVRVRGYFVNEIPHIDRNTRMRVCAYAHVHAFVCMPLHNSVLLYYTTKLCVASHSQTPLQWTVKQIDRQIPIIVHPHIKLSMSDLISGSKHFSDGFDQLEPTHSINYLALMA